MNRFRLVLLPVLFSAAFAVACSPWVKVRSKEPVYTFLDFPIERLYSETEKHIGMIFEDRFRFYRIYHSKERADPSKREQTIIGKTHFTARPVHQKINVIQIQITPRQEKWIRDRGIDRQDVIKARVRFAGISPGGSLAFDLLEILQ